MVIEGYELKVSHNSRGSWKEHIEFTEDPRAFMDKVNAIVKLHGADVYASYKASLKVNGGYAKNHETGLTQQITWKGKLNMIYKIMQFPNVNGISHEKIGRR